MNHSQNIVDKILQATNNGLDIILEIFPQANTRQNFRIRDAQDDKTLVLLYTKIEIAEDGKFTIMQEIS